MRNYILLILFTATITNCKKDLTDHWHATYKYFDEELNYAIDVEENGTAYFIERLVNKPVKGDYLAEECILNFPGSCGEGFFKCKAIGKTLYLQNSLGAHLKAKKVICNRICDYQTQLRINFLKLKKLTKDSLYNKSLNEHINIGFSKKDNSLMLETNVSDVLQPINSIDSLAYKREPYYQDDSIPFINYILTPDKNLKSNVLNNIIERLQKSGKKKIYIRTLKDSLITNDRNIFEYIRIKEGQFNFDSDKKLSEIIN